MGRIAKPMMVVTLCTAMAGVLSACGMSGAPSQPPADTGESAAALFKANCATCHGAGLQGGQGAPSLQHVGQAMNTEAIITQITHGGGGMPAFGGAIGPKDIHTLAVWLSEKK